MTTNEHVEAPEGWGAAEDLLGANVRSLRGLRRLSQGDVAERVTYLGHAWSQPTVARVEKGTRAVSVGELFALALALSVPPSRLLDVDRAELRGLVLAEGAALRADDARAWLAGDYETAPVVRWEGNDVVTVETTEESQ